MPADYLLDFSANTIKQIHVCRAKEYTFKVIEGIDYIIPNGYISVNKHISIFSEVSYSSYELLVDILNIGDFAHQMTGNFQNIAAYLFYENELIVRNDCLLKHKSQYPILIKKIIDFCCKYGDYEFPENVDDHSERKMHVSTFITRASWIFLVYRDLIKDSEWIYKHSNMLRIDVLSAHTRISPTIIKDKNGNRKITLNYDFTDVFEIAKYQLLISQISPLEKHIGLCPYCNTFYASDRKQIYCCPYHAVQMSKNNHVSKYKKVIECECCGKSFEPNNQKEKYCSTQCKRKINNQNSKMKKEL